MKEQEIIWKNRYERLKQFFCDAECEIKNSGIEKCDERAWDPPQIIYVNFCGDTCDTEKVAKAHWGEGNYDVYELKRRSPKE